jgi:hypothetical protein
MEEAAFCVRGTEGRLVLETGRMANWLHRQDLAVAVPVVRHLDGAHLVAARVDDQAHLAPDPSVVGAVLLHLPLPLAQHLLPGAVDDQVQRLKWGALE